MSVWFTVAALVLIPGATTAVGSHYQTVTTMEAALKNVPTRVPQLVFAYMRTDESSASGWYVRPGEPTLNGSPPTLVVKIESYATTADAVKRLAYAAQVAPTASEVYKGLKLYRWDDMRVLIIAGKNVVDVTAYNPTGVSLLMKVADSVLEDIGAVKKQQ